ncbi:MAG: phosphate ABC transporter permease PstA [Spirochaetales bacterium]|nr:phosphate ABC transporter permease PstA [Spirochaetales bacterium]
MKQNSYSLRNEKTRNLINNAVSFYGKDNIEIEKFKGHLFLAFCLIAAFVGIVALTSLMIYVFVDSLGWVDWQFVTSAPSRFAEKAGIFPMLMGSIWVISLVAVFSLPLGIGAAIYLEEYAKDNWLKRLIETNIANLAGVPSIVYGLLGLGFFVSTLHLRHGTVLIGAFTLTLRVLPIVIVSSQEAIRAVPDSHRFASFGLGTSRWQMIRSVVLPEAMPGIMTGTIIALANAMGETAPLIMIGAATSIFTAPKGILSPFSAMPLQIYAWSDFPGEDFQHGVTPAAIIVLLILLLTMNGIAIFIRQKFQNKKKR